MVRLSTTNQIIPPISNCNSNFLSIKQKLLTLLNRSSSLQNLFQIHAQILASGLAKDDFLSSRLIHFCSLLPSRALTHARKILAYSSPSLRPISWNILIRGYANSNTSNADAICCYIAMRRNGISPNKLTFPFLFKACSAAELRYEQGNMVHCEVVKFGLDEDVYINNSLIHFYGSCKKIFCARKLFDEMPVRSVVSWNSILTVLVDSLLSKDVFEIFREMRNGGFGADGTTMVILLSACAEVGMLSVGKWVHSMVIEKGMHLNCQLGTALVDMYAKCGKVDYALFLFNEMEAGVRNVWTWSAMILGLAQHGFAEEALQMFPKMKESSIRPNYVTFLGVLCACSHTGRIDVGYRFFLEMQNIYGIEPMMIHYGAMVDILGRAGCLKEAYQFILSMPKEPDPTVWRTLLSASIVHRANDCEEVGDTVRRKLLEIEPRRSGNFVMVANMYAEDGMWEKAANVRKAMRDGGLKKKRAGESWVDIGGYVCKFFSGDDFLEDFEDIYILLDSLILHMKMEH